MSLDRYTILGCRADEYQAKGNKADRLFVTFEHRGPKAAAFQHAQKLLRARAGRVPVYVIQFCKRRGKPERIWRRDRIASGRSTYEG